MSAVGTRAALALVTGQLAAGRVPCAELTADWPQAFESPPPSSQAPPPFLFRCVFSISYFFSFQYSIDCFFFSLFRINKRVRLHYLLFTRNETTHTHKKIKLKKIIWKKKTMKVRDNGRYWKWIEINWINRNESIVIQPTAMPWPIARTLVVTSLVTWCTRSDTVYMQISSSMQMTVSITAPRIFQLNLVIQFRF